MAYRTLDLDPIPIRVLHYTKLQTLHVHSMAHKAKAPDGLDASKLNKTAITMQSWMELLNDAKCGGAAAWTTFYS